MSLAIDPIGSDLHKNYYRSAPINNLSSAIGLKLELVVTRIIINTQTQNIYSKLGFIVQTNPHHRYYLSDYI